MPRAIFLNPISYLRLCRRFDLEDEVPREVRQACVVPVLSFHDHLICWSGAAKNGRIGLEMLI